MSGFYKLNQQLLRKSFQKLLSEMGALGSVSDPQSLETMFSNFVKDEEEKARNLPTSYTLPPQSIGVDTNINTSNNAVTSPQYGGNQSAMANSLTSNNAELFGIENIFKSSLVDAAVEAKEAPAGSKGKRYDPGDGHSSVSKTVVNAQDDTTLTLSGGQKLLVSITNTTTSWLNYKLVIRSIPLDKDGYPLNWGGVYPIAKPETIGAQRIQRHNYNGGDGAFSHRYTIYVINESKLLERPYSLNILAEARY